MTREGTCSSNGIERREITLDAQEYEKFQQDPHSYLGVDADEYDLRITVVVIDDPSPSVVVLGRPLNNEARTATDVAAAAAAASENCSNTTDDPRIAITAQHLHCTRVEQVLSSDPTPRMLPNHADCDYENDKRLSPFDDDNMDDDDGHTCASSSSGSTVESTAFGSLLDIVDSTQTTEHDGLQVWGHDSSSIGCVDVDAELNTIVIDSLSRTRVREPLARTKCGFLTTESRERLIRGILDRCLQTGRLERGASIEIADQFQITTTTVDTMWKRILESSIEGDTIVVILKHKGPRKTWLRDFELAISHPAVPKLVTRSSKVETLKDHPDCEHSSPSVRPNADPSVVEIDRTVGPLSPNIRFTRSIDDGNTGSRADDDGSTDGPSLTRNGVALTEESRELVCQALLDNCLPSGRLSENAMPKISHHFDINPNTVRTIWYCILASVTATGTIDANYGKGDNRWYPDLDREEAYTVLQKILAERNGWTEEQLAQSALARRARRASTSGQGSRERMCNGLLDRCRPNGRLERNALQDVADQYKVNRMIVQAAWKRMLASVVETGAVDPYYKKEKTQSWVPNVNYDKAYPAMQKVLAERQKNAACDAMSLTKPRDDMDAGDGKVPQKSAMNVKPNAELPLLLSSSSAIGEKPWTSLTKRPDLADTDDNDIRMEDWEEAMEPDWILSRKQQQHQHEPQKWHKRRKGGSFGNRDGRDAGAETEDWKDGLVVEPDVVPSLQHHLRKRKQLGDFDECSSHLNEASLHSNDEHWAM